MASRWLGIWSGSPRPGGIVEGRLAPCPASPNCVCTYDTDSQHAIEPLEFAGSQSDALAALRTVIHQQPRAQIVSQRENYLHAEFASLVFGFVDDVEFLIDDHQRRIHFRSASRLGRSDFGANRRRLEAIRRSWQAAQKNASR